VSVARSFDGGNGTLSTNTVTDRTRAQAVTLLDI
jgi:hypothetical protein